MNKKIISLAFIAIIIAALLCGCTAPGSSTTDEQINNPTLQVDIAPNEPLQENTLSDNSPDQQTEPQEPASQQNFQTYTLKDLPIPNIEDGVLVDKTFTCLKDGQKIERVVQLVEFPFNLEQDYETIIKGTDRFKNYYIESGDSETSERDYYKESNMFQTSYHRSKSLYASKIDENGYVSEFVSLYGSYFTNKSTNPSSMSLSICNIPYSESSDSSIPESTKAILVHAFGNDIAEYFVYGKSEEDPSSFDLELISDNENCKTILRRSIRIDKEEETIDYIFEVYFWPNKGNATGWPIEYSDSDYESLENQLKYSIMDFINVADDNIYTKEQLVNYMLDNFKVNISSAFGATTWDIYHPGENDIETNYDAYSGKYEEEYEYDGNFVGNYQVKESADGTVSNWYSTVSGGTEGYGSSRWRLEIIDTEEAQKARAEQVEAYKASLLECERIVNFLYPGLTWDHVDLDGIEEQLQDEGTSVTYTNDTTYEINNQNVKLTYTIGAHQNGISGAWYGTYKIVCNYSNT